MKKLIACLIILLTFALAACGKSSTPSPTPAPSAGAGGAATTVDAQSLYKQNCMSCHGNNMKGGAGPSLKTVGAKLNKDQIVAILTNGKGAMPSFKSKLSSDQIVGLADWLATHK